MTMCQLIVKITLTSLFSGLVVFTAVVVLNLSRRHPVGKRVHKALLSRTRIILIFLVLLIILMPAVFSLLRGTLLFLEELAVYVREALVSVFVVVALVLSFSVTQEILNASDLWTYVQISMAQIASLTKILRGDITGWYELREDIQFGKGLRLVAHLAMKIVLWYGKSGGYKKQLQLLVS